MNTEDKYYWSLLDPINYSLIAVVLPKIGVNANILTQLQQCELCK